ncbi:pyoverdine biosynthesis protein PvdE [Azorhizobium oxalatiphilum]|uniref:Pyoverdine biosynthesis protein PvdE n=1 Tax=Azorhizobium oxalatiphilum TaxID=980631 RepID=A0A917BWC5_9HYPH|nr:cyclic peptide export ABC transporter [Azorhizobium oxalatiphilum]GGF58222.1 pyoverdine biosynthesis protein PvdE [Azorhizobium oxalatiphilum]
MTAASTVSLTSAATRLLRPYWPIALLATAMGIASGIGTTFLLATINRLLHAEGGVPTAALLTFGGLCLLVVGGEIVSDLGNSFVGQHVVAAMRRDVSERILAAPIDQLERYRLHRLITTLTTDVDTVSGFTFAFSSLAIALAVSCGALAYLVWLSPGMALVSIIAIAIGSIMHGMARAAGRRRFEAARTLQDELQQHYRALTEGAKELRISRMRRLFLLDRQLGPTITGIRDLRVAAMRVFMSANAFSSILFFALIGLLLALRGVFAVSNEALSGFVLVLLYVKGPLQQLVSALPMIGQAQVSFLRIAELSAELSSSDTGLLDRTRRAPERFSTIELRDVRYAFQPGDGARAFALGPLSLTVHAGETLFIVGENGSGKTTLIKLLLGLYVPQAGTVLRDGRPVTAETRDDYRQLFSTVFTDYYLFADLAGRDVAPTAADRLLRELEMEGKVAIRDGRFTTTDLSTGQRKRLALVHAGLEDRPIVMFDEWAADQDPSFRATFYGRILPDLKRQGKTCIVISHDDRYFESADRIIRLADGRLAHGAPLPQPPSVAHS